MLLLWLKLKDGYTTVLNQETEVPTFAQHTLLQSTKLLAFSPLTTSTAQSSLQETFTLLTSSTPTSQDQLHALKLIQINHSVKSLENTE